MINKVQYMNMKIESEQISLRVYTCIPKIKYSLKDELDSIWI